MPEADVQPAKLSAPRLAARSLLPLLACVGLALLFHLVAAPLMKPLHVKLAMDIGINIILAVSLNMINGFTGQFSIGHAGFMAIGAYTAGAFTYYGGLGDVWGDESFTHGILSWSRPLADFTGNLFTAGDILFLAACLVGGLMAALIGLVVGLPSLRLRGDYLAVVTLGFGDIIRLLMELSDGQLKTVADIQSTPYFQRYTHLGGASAMSGLSFMTTTFWVVLFACFTLLAAFRLRMSSHGRAFLAIRENEIAAESMGVPTTRYKVAAFVLAAGFAGFAGGLFAHQSSVLNPGDYGFIKSFDILIMVVLGGQGSISGTVIAATVITLLSEFLVRPPHLWILGLIVILLLAVFRQRKAMRAIIMVAVATIVWEIARALALHFQINLAQYRMILFALALVLIMILRPQGLLGIREVWDYLPGRKRLPTEMKA
ncbi:MAG: branched-chain amino acid ABC transporter permease [Phycisphaeraceae bacterium]